MKHHSRVRPGFTLIELLTVVAIIAVLAAIIFPVTATVRRNVRRNQCQAQLQQIVQALRLYKDDHGKYPEALSQFARGTTADTIVPQLYPQYIDSESTFTCPVSVAKALPATWSPAAGADLTGGCPGSAGGLPCWMQPLDRSINGPSTTFLAPQSPIYLPEGDTYSMQLLPNQRQNPPASTWERHYSQLWTNDLNSQPDRRQLVYNNPSEQTVVTWCMYHATLDAQGVPGRGDLAIVAFLDGRVQLLTAEKLANWAAPTYDGLPFRALPNP